MKQGQHSGAIDQWAAGLASILLIAAVCGCRRDMQDQPRYQPLQASRFFTNGRSARPVPAGTVARDELDLLNPVHTGEMHGEFLQTIPVPVTRGVLLRGEERYNIYCSPCHSRIGDGNGMITRRGVKWPANLHSDRLRQAPPGYLFQVITHGYGAMMSYQNQIDVSDRWAIVAYVRALQLSRNATVADVPPANRAALEQVR